MQKFLSDIIQWQNVSARSEDGKELKAETGSPQGKVVAVVIGLRDGLEGCGHGGEENGGVVMERRGKGEWS